MRKFRLNEKGSAVLVGIAAISMVLLMGLTMLAIIQMSGRMISRQRLYQGQALNAADAGLTDTLAWFTTRTVQPVTSYAPIRNMSATPPVNETEVQSIGIVRTYPLTNLGNLWGRYEARLASVSDVSTQRGKSSAGTMWQVESNGIVFRDADNDGVFDWTDSNSNGVYDKGEAGEGIIMRKLRTEIQRLSLVLPAGNAAVHGYTCSTVNTTTGGSRVRVWGTSAGTGIGCRSGSGSPTTTGTSITGTPAIQSSVSPYNSTVSNVFGVSQGELIAMANLSVTSVASLPASLPAMSLIVINGNAAFTTAKPLTGSGILVVFGNLTIPANTFSSWSGVIYVTGTTSITAPTTISGALVGQGNISLVGGASDFVQCTWDSTTVSQIRQALGGYRFSRASYLVP